MLFSCYKRWILYHTETGQTTHCVYFKDVGILIRYLWKITNAVTIHTNNLDVVPCGDPCVGSPVFVIRSVQTGPIWEQLHSVFGIKNLSQMFSVNWQLWSDLALTLIWLNLWASATDAKQKKKTKQILYITERGLLWQSEIIVSLTLYFTNVVWSIRFQFQIGFGCIYIFIKWCPAIQF